MKNLLKSKAFWVALGGVVIAVATAFGVSDPEVLKEIFGAAGNLAETVGEGAQ